jgi:hypothetical protein
MLPPSSYKVYVYGERKKFFENIFKKWERGMKLIKYA